MTDKERFAAVMEFHTWSPPLTVRQLIDLLLAKVASGVPENWLVNFGDGNARECIGAIPIWQYPNPWNCPPEEDSLLLTTNLLSLGSLARLADVDIDVAMAYMREIGKIP